jgi:ATP synthase F1 gamma subunit
MITKKNLENEITNLIGLRVMVRAYEEIAASRIKKSRDSVLRNRAFMSEVNEIFEEVITSYRKQIEEYMKQRKAKSINDLTFVNKNGKTLYLLISANTGLYGSLIKRTFELFIQKTKQKKGDIAIIGRLGQSMWQASGQKDQYYYFDFPDQSVDSDALKKILDFLISYQSVVIFYGEFQNLVRQDATYSDISGNSFESEANTGKPRPIIKYYFEPSLAKILEFFEKQIFAAIFEQTVRESQLAKLASRLTLLDSASENISKKIDNVTIEKNIIHHQHLNKKQLETFASRSLWDKYKT